VENEPFSSFKRQYLENGTGYMAVISVIITLHNHDVNASNFDHLATFPPWLAD